MRLVRSGGLALLIVLCALVPSAAAAPALGLQDIGSTPADVDVAASTGVKLLRVQAFWAAIEPRGPGLVDAAAIARLDAVVARARLRGMKVVLFADGTPCWASSAPAGGPCGGGPPRSAFYRYPPRDPQDFVAFSRFLLQRYASDVAAYEIWNEPDQSNEQYWAGPDKVERYVALLKAAYAPLKQVAPSVPILGGSFVGTNGAWLKAMYAEGAKGHYDGLAVHFYDLPLYGLRMTREVQRRYGDTTPMWLTEFGWSSCARKGGPAKLVGHPCTTPAQQARNLEDLVSALQRTSWVRAAVLYAIRDAGDYRFGILDARNRSKPLRASLQRAAARRARSRRPALRLSTTSRGRLRASASFTAIDTATLTLSVGGRLRFRAFFRADQYGRARLDLPASLPRRGVVVRLRESFTGKSVTRRR